jgi:hypothetical protein
VGSSKTLRDGLKASHSRRSFFPLRDRTADYVSTALREQEGGARVGFRSYGITGPLAQRILEVPLPPERTMIEVSDFIRCACARASLSYVHEQKRARVPHLFMQCEDFV